LISDCLEVIVDTCVASYSQVFEQDSLRFLSHGGLIYSLGFWFCYKMLQMILSD